PMGPAAGLPSPGTCPASQRPRPWRTALRYPYRSHRPAQPTGPPHPPADTIAGCPPHYWLIAERLMTCRKCGLERQLARDGQVILPELPAVSPDPVAAPEASTAPDALATTTSGA